MTGTQSGVTYIIQEGYQWKEHELLSTYKPHANVLHELTWKQWAFEYGLLFIRTVYRCVFYSGRFLVWKDGVSIQNFSHIAIWPIELCKSNWRQISLTNKMLVNTQHKHINHFGCINNVSVYGMLCWWAVSLNYFTWWSCEWFLIDRIVFIPLLPLRGVPTSTGWSKIHWGIHLPPNLTYG